MGYLTREEKVKQVLNLLEQNKTYREIQSKAHVTPNFISNVVRKTYGEKSIICNSDSRISKNPKAIQLLCEGKLPITIARELDIDADQMEKACSDFIRLNNLGRFNHLIKNSNRQKLSLLIKLEDFLDKKDIKTTESMEKIFIDIQSHDILKEEINRFSQMKIDLNFENLELQNRINEKIQFYKRSRNGYGSPNQKMMN